MKENTKQPHEVSLENKRIALDYMFKIFDRDQKVNLVMASISMNEDKFLHISETLIKISTIRKVEKYRAKHGKENKVVLAISDLYDDFDMNTKEEEEEKELRAKTQSESPVDLF